MNTTSMSQGKAMYVASDSGRSWLLGKQRALYTRSQHDPDYIFRKLWGLVTEPANLRLALARVAHNKGARTSGVDRVTVKRLLDDGADAFLDSLRAEFRAGSYRVSPVRRMLIPKAGQPGKLRPLGIPTVKDRVVQAALKAILEPIFEADFYPTSFGFRPGKGVHGAIEYLKILLHPKLTKADGPRLPYQWAIEGDIKGCFDNISHHGLMERVRLRVGDGKVNRLVLAFLKAGVLSGQQLTRSDNGTPQGGILSPLLANIALSVLDERYERFVRPGRDASFRPRHTRVEDHALNPMLRGWGAFYRHAWRASRVFAKLDDHVWRTILRWIQKKHGFSGSLLRDAELWDSHRTEAHRLRRHSRLLVVRRKSKGRLPAAHCLLRMCYWLSQITA